MDKVSLVRNMRIAKAIAGEHKRRAKMAFHAYERDKVFAEATDGDDKQTYARSALANLKRFAGFMDGYYGEIANAAWFRTQFKEIKGGMY